MIRTTTSFSLLFLKGKASKKVTNKLHRMSQGGSSKFGQAGSRPFIFVSTFKWEARKGWDKLVQAYLEVMTDYVGHNRVPAVCAWKAWSRSRNSNVY
jgi:hypothetical protein